MDDLTSTCDEIIEETKTPPKTFNEKITTLKKTFFILFAFLLVTIALFIAFI